MPITFDEDGPPNVSGKPRGNEMDIVASHQRLLVGSALRTEGIIIELGVGWYSTPLLHEVAEMQKRQVITFDNNIDWLRQFTGLNSKYHKLQLIDWWGSLGRDLNQRDINHIGLVFVDNGQPIEREYCTRSILNHCSVDVFVFHDTEEDFAYGYSRILPMFRHKWTDKCQKAWTTVASNNVDVTKWFTELPPVNPSQDIT